ncbi:MAG: DUF2190 family protein [Melioribacteraceae bacterium]|nr:DUF2190 family protein [Melioribacteraceae bacterium]
MFTELPGIIVNHKVTTNFNKGTFVNFTGESCPNNVKGLGVINADSSATEIAPVVIAGIALVTTGGAFGAGDPIISDMMGRAVAQGAVDSKHIMGFALDQSTASNQTVRILLR